MARPKKAVAAPPPDIRPPVELPNVVLTLTPTPFGDESPTKSVNKAGCALLRDWLAARWSTWDESEKGLPDYFIARELGVHRLVWSQWKAGMQRCGELRPAFHPKIDVVLLADRAMKAQVEMIVQPYDPWTDRSWDDRFYWFGGLPGDCEYYVHDHYRADVDEMELFTGHARRIDGKPFSPVRFDFPDPRPVGKGIPPRSRKKEIEQGCFGDDLLATTSLIIKPVF